MIASERKNIAIVCNPLAGAGRAKRLATAIKKELERRSLTHTLFTDSWPLSFHAFSDVWIVGGDGTLNYFINRYPGIRLPLAIFRGGTGNDVHSILYGKQSWKEQIEYVLKTAPKPLDAADCNGKLFINGTGIGFEGEVARSLTGKKKLPGKMSFLAVILQKIFSYRSRHYNITCDEISSDERFLFISVMNGKRAGGGFMVAPASVFNDGLLDMVLVKPLGIFQRLRYLPVIEKGKHLDLSFITYLRTKKVCFESRQPIQAHLDGEYYSASKLEISILPAAFYVRY